MLSDMELMNFQARLLFNHDENGRLTTVNDGTNRIAPRFFLGHTKGGNVKRYLHSLGADVIEALQQATGDHDRINLAEIVHILNRDRQLDRIWIGPAYVFPDVRGRSTQAVRITQENQSLLQSHFSDFLGDLAAMQPFFVIVRDGVAVSLCCSARLSSVGAEASVQTAADFRGKGYGVEVSIAWAAAMQSRGLIALYSTSWHNSASQAVAKKLQLIQYGTDLHFS
ncbi:GNAT family N-acetyltransferase [Alicyclobacillus fodiniaquatilis]|uniref:GNAT family N-acetyltransferase n=1 Tax=Alicyclobacillus fodiniaquatilis TaxID=1661150 RepID=A0ABW4JG51_9BACL